MFGIDANHGFLGSLITTLVLLAVVVRSGKSKSLAIHVPAVLLTLAALAFTIVFAKKLGPHYDLHAAGVITPIHLWIAKLATAAYLAPLVTGLMTWRDRKWRSLHGKLAFTTIALTVVTALTGTLMLMWAPEL